MIENPPVAPLDNPAVLIVIVNYRTARLVVDCLESLEPEVRQHAGARVVVVDNQSQDGSPAVIAEAIAARGWGAWASVQESPRNGGFAYGNNLAIRPALASDRPPDYYWLVNPDTQVRPGALGELISFLQGHPSAGVAGGMLEADDGAPWPFAFRFPTILSEIEHGMKFSLVTRLLQRWVVTRRMGEVPDEVDWLPGASMMIRREVFESVGLLDEDYFLYYEETDFCLQAKRAGWSSWYVPQSRVMHIAGQSTGVTDRYAEPRRMPTYWFESRRRFFVKNYGRAYAMAADVAWILSFLTYRFRKWVQNKREVDPPRLLSDFIRNSSILRT